MSQTRTRSFELFFEGQSQRRIRGRIETPDGATDRVPHVLVLHGFKGFMDWGFFPFLQRRLAQAGLGSVAFNTSGSGVGQDLATISEDDAFATATYTRDLEDVERVAAWIASTDLPLDPRRGGIFGHSRGGGVALLFAARHPEYRALVTWAAIDDCDRFSPEQREELARTGHTFVPNQRTGQLHRLDRIVLDDLDENRADLDILAACRRVQAPALVAHGSADPAVPASAAQHIHEALAASEKELLLVGGEGHTFGATHPLIDVPPNLDRLVGATVAHFARHLG